MKRIFLIFFVFISALALLFIYSWQSIYFPFAPGSSEQILFNIEKGQSAKSIAASLEKEGVIKSALLFRVYVLLEGVSQSIQAGTFLLSPSMSIPEIVGKITSGDAAKNNITIIEGWNLDDISAYFEEEGIEFANQILLMKAASYKKDFKFLESVPDEASLEGFLFPDTYRLSSGAGAEGAIRKILENFDKKLTSDLREEIARQKKTIFEIVTTASLIEKEVRTIEDKKLVSGVIKNRLEIGMPLQIDAAISYITGKRTTEISIAETKIDSPYNTYKYRGLPVGPICNPGLDSILAAIYPLDSPYLYYLSTPEGKTIFSKTLGEHNVAKAKYLR